MGNQNCTQMCSQTRDENSFQGKNVLIVLAHPEQKSFCACLRDMILEILTKKGYKVYESDLYAQKFNPVATIKDFTVELDSNEDTDFSREGIEGTVPIKIQPDIQEEIAKVLNADYVIFIFPLWWESIPAILKGWFDRVIIAGIIQDKGSFRGRSKIKGKKAVVVCPASPPAYSPNDNVENPDLPVLSVSAKKLQQQPQQPAKPRRKTMMIPRGFDERLKHFTNGLLAFSGFDQFPLISNLTVTIQDEDGVKVDYIKEVRKYFEEFEQQDVVLRGENIPFGL